MIFLICLLKYEKKSCITYLLTNVFFSKITCILRKNPIPKEQNITHTMTDGKYHQIIFQDIFIKYILTLIGHCLPK